MKCEITWQNQLSRVGKDIRRGGLEGDHIKESVVSVPGASMCLACVHEMDTRFKVFGSTCVMAVAEGDMGQMEEDKDDRGCYQQLRNNNINKQK